MRVPSLVCLLCFSLLAAGTTPADQAQISYVYGYTGLASAYRITHAGKTQTIAPFLPLQNGDRVTIVRSSNSGVRSVVTLSIDGVLYSVDAAHSPFCVGAASGKCTAGAHPSAPSNPALTILKHVLASIAPIFGEAQDDYYSSHVDQMVSRGVPSPPSIPMLPRSPLAVTPATSTSLSLQWLNGTPPFTVTLYSGDTAVARKTGVVQNSVTLDDLRLTAGTYHVVIEDSQHLKGDGRFKAVAEDLPNPPLPIDKIAPYLPPAQLATVRAGLLAHRGMQYYLMAYQALAPLPDDAPQAGQLRNWLAEGEPPPP